jgi:enoyl-CoA hydratase
MNMLLAADLRIVAKDARLMSGFVRHGLHPGGGHIHLLARLAGRETAAAMAMFAAEVSGERAVQLGVAWEAVDAQDVEARARELASRVAARPQLARRLVSSFRQEADSFRIGWSTALEFERTSQLWAMRNTA